VTDAEYEVSKNYLLSGTEVLSEVVSEEITSEYRAFHLRTSCPSKRWGTRTLGHGLTHYNNATEDPLVALERIRRAEAERILKIESGELPEGGLKFLGIQIQGPTGKSVTTMASTDLSISASLVGAEIVNALGLQPLTKSSYQEQIISLPLFKMRVLWGTTRVETMAAVADLGSPPCVLGGDFFQKALKGKEELIQELIIRDDRRALVNAARCKKKFVLILGKYGEHRSRLEGIKEILSSLGFVGLILDEYPDIEEQPLPEKVVTYASICRFVIVDDFVPSGHISEMEICRERKFVTAILRHDGKGSTTMQADVADEVEFMRGFSYTTDENFKLTVRDAAKWADNSVRERAMRLNRSYTWRGPANILG